MNEIEDILYNLYSRKVETLMDNPHLIQKARYYYDLSIEKYRKELLLIRTFY